MCLPPLIAWCPPHFVGKDPDSMKSQSSASLMRLWVWPLLVCGRLDRFEGHDASLARMFLMFLQKGSGTTFPMHAGQRCTSFLHISAKPWIGLGGSPMILVCKGGLDGTWFLKLFIQNVIPICGWSFPILDVWIGRCLSWSRTWCTTLIV